MPSKPIKILLIEDDPEQASFLSQFLSEPKEGLAHFELESTNMLSSGLEKLSRSAYDIVLLDLGLPDSSGIDTFSRLASVVPRLPVIAFTGLGDESLALETVSRGAQDYLVKGSFNSATLRRAIVYSIERKRLATQLEDLIARNADGMVVVDDKGIVRYVNPAAEQILETKSERLVGKPFDFPAIPDQTAELKFPSVHGGDRIAQMRTSSIEWQGRPACLSSIRDITELRHLEQLKAEVKEHRRLDKLKDEFITSVSTELRAPLTVLYGAISSLLRGVYGSLSDSQSRTAKIAQKSAERLVRSVNNILDISQLEAGHAKLHLGPVNVWDVFRDVISNLSAQAKERGVTIETRVPPNLPPMEADAELIAQALRQLVENAIRYCKRHVVLSARRVDGLLPASTDSNRRSLGLGITMVSSRHGIQLSVFDDGPGIPKEKQGLLFQKFVQIQPSDRVGPNGTGLGLAICKEIVQCHQGKVWVESVGDGSLECGTEFHLVVPEHAKKSGAPKPGETRSWSSSRSRRAGS